MNGLPEVGCIIQLNNVINDPCMNPYILGLGNGDPLTL